jgi:hypothetical protein
MSLVHRQIETAALPDDRPLSDPSKHEDSEGDREDGE